MFKQLLYLNLACSNYYNLTIVEIKQGINHVIILYALIFVGVNVRFTETSHSISEDGNIQTVCAELIGLIQTPVSVTLTTQDGSATS